MDVWGVGGGKGKVGLGLMSGKNNSEERTAAWRKSKTGSCAMESQ